MCVRVSFGRVVCSEQEGRGHTLFSQANLTLPEPSDLLTKKFFNNSEARKNIYIQKKLSFKINDDVIFAKN